MNKIILISISALIIILLTFIFMAGGENEIEFDLEDCSAEVADIVLNVSYAISGIDQERTRYYRIVEFDPSIVKIKNTAIFTDGPGLATGISYDIIRSGKNKFDLNITGYIKYNGKDINLNESIPLSFLNNSRGQKEDFSWNVTWEDRRK